jgi:hypothetical protein
MNPFVKPTASPTPLPNKPVPGTPPPDVPPPAEPPGTPPLAAESTGTPPTGTPPTGTPPTGTPPTGTPPTGTGPTGTPPTGTGPTGTGPTGTGPTGTAPAGSAQPCPRTPASAAEPIAPAGLTTPALEDELVSLAGHLTAAHCRWLLLLAEFDARDGWGGPGMRSCAHWLAWRVGMSVRTALDQLRVARALATLPAITRSFAEGCISYSKVRAITRIATPDTEQPLLELALAGTAGHVERVVRLTRQASARPDTEVTQRSVRWHFDDEGYLHLTARLPAEQGAALVAALNGLVDELDRPPAPRSAERDQPRTNPSDPTQRSAERRPPTNSPNRPTQRSAERRPPTNTPSDPTQRSAERRPPTNSSNRPAQRSAERRPPRTSPAVPTQRSAERSEPSTSANTRATNSPTETTATRHAEPMSVRRADALVAMATGIRPTNPEIVVHLNVDRHEAQIERGPGVPVSTAERLACDARVRPLLKDRRGNPLYLGRTRRLVSKTLLAAVRFRDDHQCRFPGCTHTRWLHAHHIRHWLRGGGTDIDNLVMLCEFHHQLVHDHGFQIRGRGTRLRFIAPNGQHIPPAGPPTEGTSRTLVELSKVCGGGSGKDSLTPTWAGERLDPTPILMRLLPERRLARTAA